MRLATPEQIQQAGLTVVRNHFDQDVAHDFANEWIEFFKRPETFTNDPLAKKYGVARLGGWTAAFAYQKNELPATNRFLEHVGLQHSKRVMQVNCQLPFASQNLHEDGENVEGDVHLYHMSDDGAFDFALAETPEARAPENLVSIQSLSAGDLVVQSRPDFSHRGRNMSRLSRITLGMCMASAAFEARLTARS